MEIIKFRDIDLTNDVKTIDYMPFNEKYTNFYLKTLIEVDINSLADNNVNTILNMSSIITINGSQTIGNGYDISIVKGNNDIYLKILYLVGQDIEIMKIPEDLKTLKLNINISHIKQNSKININGIDNYIKIRKQSFNSIVLGGKEDLYGNIINKTPIKIIDFELNY